MSYTPRVCEAPPKKKDLAQNNHRRREKNEENQSDGANGCVQDETAANPTNHDKRTRHANEGERARHKTEERKRREENYKLRTIATNNNLTTRRRTTTTHTADPNRLDLTVSRTAGRFLPPSRDQLSHSLDLTWSHLRWLTQVTTITLALRFQAL